ncbi:MAG: D-alanine--D-alanine ligase [Planctomycetes bacterium]|nr:D-alanine--D-alanine ligase [Planctomycetota bacterium]
MDIAVLAGGRSPEHDISLQSVRQVLRHLDRDRWRVWPVFLDREGCFWPEPAPLPAGSDWRPGDSTAAAASGARPMRPGAALDFLLDHAGIEVVLPILHGPVGEDGTLQGMLELYDLPCVGSGSAASAVAMDKLRTREALAAAGVPQPQAYRPHERLSVADAQREFAAIQIAIGTPAFVKADASGSTVGVAKVCSEEGLAAFFAEFGGTFRRWYAEEQVVGEEITVAVLGNSGGELQVLPAIGIYPKTSAFFTTEAKYTPGATEEVIPPRGLSESQLAEVAALARTCHEALVCDGMSRTDMIVGVDGPRVLEVNTIPGLTETSLLPQAAAAAGLSFGHLLDRLLELALERAGRPAPAAASYRTELMS